jgi:SAM-dependent methyltransferase
MKPEHYLTQGINKSMPSTIEYPNYNPIAQVNNEYYSCQYFEHILPSVQQLLLSNLSIGAKVIDLCCGAGRLTQALLKEGYKVTGIDSSEEMLRYARDNAPNGEFILGDVRLFELSPVFDAAVSTGALNHIMCQEDLISVFKNVYRVLRNNGRFVFNILLDEGFQAGWDGFTLSDAKDDCAWIVKHIYDPKDKIGQIKITGFELNAGNWQRLDDTMLVKSYSSNEVISALEQVGFSQVSIHQSEPDFQNSNNKTWETFFIACK